MKKIILVFVTIFLSIQICVQLLFLHIQSINSENKKQNLISIFNNEYFVSNPYQLGRALEEFESRKEIKCISLTENFKNFEFINTNYKSNCAINPWFLSGEKIEAKFKSINGIQWTLSFISNNNSGFLILLWTVRVFMTFFFIMFIMFIRNRIALEKIKYEKKLVEFQKLAAIGQTAAMLAHDVRKPFSSIKLVLANFDFFAKNPEKLTIAKKDIDVNLKNVENMIADIMDFSRETKYDLQSCDIKNIIEKSIKQNENSIDQSKFNINYKAIFSHLHDPLIDEQKMTRVFQNIFGNAVEAITIMGGKTSGEICIETYDIEKSFYIKISNDGPIFDKNINENIFETFYTKGKNSGTGLGLASVKKIIELHGGKISAANKSNNDGVEFVIELPL